MASERFDAAVFLTGLFIEPAADDPQDLGPVVTPDDLPADWREVYEERAAIREYDGGQVREHAEAEALGEVLAAMRLGGGR
jgi:hypothetical protein